MWGHWWRWRGAATHQGAARTAAVRSRQTQGRDPSPAPWRLPREQGPAYSLISDGWPPALGEKSIALSVTLAEGAAAVNHRLAGGAQRDGHADVSPPPRVGPSLPRPQHAGKPGVAAPGKVTTNVSLLEQEEVVRGSGRANRHLQHRERFSSYSHLLIRGFVRITELFSTLTKSFEEYKLFLDDRLGSLPSILHAPPPRALCPRWSSCRRTFARAVPAP